MYLFINWKSRIWNQNEFDWWYLNQIKIKISASLTKTFYKTFLVKKLISDIAINAKLCKIHFVFSIFVTVSSTFTRFMKFRVLGNQIDNDQLSSTQSIFNFRINANVILIDFICHDFYVRSVIKTVRKIFSILHSLL